MRGAGIDQAERRSAVTTRLPATCRRAASGAACTAPHRAVQRLEGRESRQPRVHAQAHNFYFCLICILIYKDICYGDPQSSTLDTFVLDSLGAVETAFLARCRSRRGGPFKEAEAARCRAQTRRPAQIKDEVTPPPRSNHVVQLWGGGAAQLIES